MTRLTNKESTDFNDVPSKTSKGKRLMDFVFSTLIIVIFSPLLALGWLVSGGSFKRTRMIGQGCGVYEELSFNTDHGWSGRILKKLRLERLPVLINIAEGNMSFVGPLSISADHLNSISCDERTRYSVRPGLISLWWIRNRANIDYGTEMESDIEYVNNHGIRMDVGILLRAIPAALFGARAASCGKTLSILGIPVNNCTMTEAIEIIGDWSHGSTPRQVCFVNADCANIAYKNQEYLNVLRRSELCLADGIGMKLGAKILSQDITQNVNGTDMFPLLCHHLSGSGIRLFLLGARPEVVEGVVEWTHDKYPLVEICGRRHGYFGPEEETKVIEDIKSCKTDLLLVAFGAPKQDIWIHNNLAHTGAKVAAGVGGLFDFYSGRIPRAPLWMREIGMEWLYRLIQEPGRLWKRYLIGNGLFLFRVAKQRFFESPK